VNRVVWANDTAAATTVFAIVDNFDDPDAGGTFVLNVTLETVPMGDRCFGARPLAVGSAMGTTVGAANDYGFGTSCSGTAGSDVVYEVVVPAGQRATVTVAPGDMTFNPSINLVAGPAATCGGSPRACLAGDDSGMQATTNSAAWVNASAAPVTIYAVVDSASATLSGPFTTTLAIDTPPVSPCSTARSVPAGGTTTLTAEDTRTGAARFAASGCGGGTAANNTRYYSVTVPANSTMTVRGTPTAFDLVLSAADSCAAATCSTNVDAGGDGGAETLTLSNTTAATVTRIVMARAYTGLGGLVDLVFTTIANPIPPTRSPIAAMCVDMSAATPVAGVTTDDSVSTVTALPFTVSYFGSPMTHYSVSSNGFIQLWPSSAGSPSSSFSNTTLPAAGTPNSVVAAFWDDLRPNAGADVRTLTTGAAGSRIFTTQWTNWRATGAGTEALTFQAQFAETTGRIEFHYCTMTAGAGMENTGSSATIGVEDATGGFASLQSFNTAGAVMTGSGFRFTP
jgi:hypothetical protein